MSAAGGDEYRFAWLLIHPKAHHTFLFKELLTAPIIQVDCLRVNRVTRKIFPEFPTEEASDFMSVFTPEEVPYSATIAAVWLLLGMHHDVHRISHIHMKTC